MSRFKSFKEISTYMTLEDEDIVVETPAGEGQMDVSDVIEEQAVQDEVNGDIAKIEDAQLQVEEAMEVVDELEEQIENNEQILEESPEQVTEDTVAIAQEAVMISFAKLGYTMSEFGIARMSQEDRSTSPVQALKLSTEGVKEVLVTIKDKIAAMFKKVIEWIKALFSKVAGLFKANEKKAVALEQKIKQAKDLNFNFKDEDLVQALSPLTGIIAVTNGKVNVVDILDFISFDVMSMFSKAFDLLHLKAKSNFENLDFAQLSEDLTNGLKTEGERLAIANKVIMYSLITPNGMRNEDIEGLPIAITNDYVLMILDDYDNDRVNLASARIKPESKKNVNNYKNFAPKSKEEILIYPRLGKKICAASKLHADKLRIGTDKLNKSIFDVLKVGCDLGIKTSNKIQNNFADPDNEKMSNDYEKYTKMIHSFTASLSRVAVACATANLKQYITYGKAFLTVGNNLFNLASK